MRNRWIEHKDARLSGNKIRFALFQQNDLRLVGRDALARPIVFELQNVFIFVGGKPRHHILVPFAVGASRISEISRIAEGAERQHLFKIPRRARDNMIQIVFFFHGEAHFFECCKVIYKFIVYACGEFCLRLLRVVRIAARLHPVFAHQCPEFVRAYHRRNTDHFVLNRSERFDRLSLNAVQYVRPVIFEVFGDIQIPIVRHDGVVDPRAAARMGYRYIQLISARHCIVHLRGQIFSGICDLKIERNARVFIISLLDMIDDLSLF